MIKKQMLAGGLAALALAGAAQADAIPFATSQFDATVVATTADGLPGFDSQSGSLIDTVSLSTSSVGTSDVTTAGAVVDAGLLTASADVSAAAIANAVATAHFTGSFINGSAVSLRLDFNSSSFAAGTGAASSTLFVSLTSNGATLFADYVTGLWTLSYTPILGSTSVLDLTLTSDASAAFPAAGTGNSSSFGIVTIAGSVPEASTWALFALGLGVLGAVRLKASRGRA